VRPVHRCEEQQAHAGGKEPEGVGKLYIRQAGEDMAGMDIAPGSPARMTAVSAHERAPVRLLASVLPGRSEPRESRLLTAATEGNWQSA
jgi:hypothetical protein